MSWLDNVIRPLRVVINDIDGNTYTDTVLHQLIVTAASYVVQEVRLETSYTVNFTNFTVSPDPSSDNLFINMVALKANCLINLWDVNIRAKQAGISAKIGPVTGSISDAGNTIYKLLLENGSCAAYDQLRLEINLSGPLASNVRAIMSPFISDTYQPNMISRDRYV